MPEFATNLKTPRWEIANAGVEAERLLDSKRFLTIQAAYDVSDKTYEYQVEAAYATGHLVRQTLRFEYYDIKDTDWLTPTDITAGQITNCHGYSIVTSECLDRIGVPHFVSYANTHSFITLQTPDGDHTNLIDVSEKKLYVDIDGAVNEPSFGQQADLGVSAANKLNMDVVLARAENPPVKEWMDFGLTRQTRSFSEAAPRDTTLMLRTYEPEQGRKVLEAYSNFNLAVQRRAFDVAHDKLQPLDHEYPEIDRRNKFLGPSRLVRELARTGRMTDALHDIEIVENSLWATRDVLTHLWPPDTRRSLGVFAARPDLIDRSIAEYEAIVQDRKETGQSVGVINGRIRKAKLQWARARKA